MLIKDHTEKLKDINFAKFLPTLKPSLTFYLNPNPNTKENPSPSQETEEQVGINCNNDSRIVVIPIHPRLAKELSTLLPIEGLTLITGTRGRPIRGDVLTNSIRKEAKRLGIINPPPLHGLRKNAVMRLYEVGCSVEEIHAITGQSHQMIHHYGQAYNRDRLVDSVVVKIERDWTEKQ